MSSKKDNKLDLRINELIIRTAPIIVSIFITIGLVMSQLWGAEMFYDYIAWSLSVVIPFIISTIISTILIGYAEQITSSARLTKIAVPFKHLSIWLFFSGWVSLIILAIMWSLKWVINQAIVVILILALFYTIGGEIYRKVIHTSSRS